MLFCGYAVNGNSFLEKDILKLSVPVVYDLLRCGTTHYSGVLRKYTNCDNYAAFVVLLTVYF